MAINKLYCFFAEAVAIVLFILVAIAFVVGKNFENMMGRNLLDFITLTAFSLVGGEMFNRRRNEKDLVELTDSCEPKIHISED